MPMSLEGFAARIRATRVERGLTQEQLAELTGLSTRYIGNLEQASRRPSFDAIYKLCCGLGTTPDHLFRDSISEEMLEGLSRPVDDPNTLRQMMTVLSDALSDVLLFEDEEPPVLFGARADCLFSAAQMTEFESLTDILSDDEHGV